MVKTKNPKTLRTANIRIHTNNNTKNGLVVFSISDIKKTLEDWLQTSQFQYWLIEHGIDEQDDIKVKHCHIVIKFKYPTKFETIKSHFPYGHIESSRNIRNSIQYLIHMNDTSKTQYPKSSIITNSKKSLEKYLIPHQTKDDISEILQRIKDGDIREYNQFEKIPLTVWSRHRTRIENAFIYQKEKIYMNKNRDIEGVFISGATGTGKTTFSKMWCQKKKKTFCISSSSNDPLQDYKGEDVLVLDDLRDDSFTFADLLKILDNHTKSTSKSRYHNKNFIGDTIIITSTSPLEYWYQHVSEQARQQLKRRLRTQFQLTDKVINFFQYDPDFRRYREVDTYVNNISSSFNNPTQFTDMADDLGFIKFNNMSLFNDPVS